MRRWLVCRLGIILISMVGVLPAQEHSFQELYQQAEQLRDSGEASPEAIRAAYAEALQRFLQQPQAGAAYLEQLPAAAFSALQCGDSRHCRELADEAWAAGKRSDTLVYMRLQGRQPEPALRLAYELRNLEEPRVRAWLASQNPGQLLPIADRWLRGSDRAMGLWLFTTLAKERGDADSYANLGLALRQIGEEEKARAAYASAMKLSPTAAWIWNDYGLLLKGSGSSEKAAAAFTESLRRKKPGQFGAAAINLGILSLRGFFNSDEPLLSKLQEGADRAMARQILLDLLLAGA